ncbi:MAG TPA: hypothetical protein VE955_00370 [Candidatus Dormibacteraeota bacterium]|nr:hypothetical protein [Candidatus Dormibacteraeota bacterium]
MNATRASSPKSKSASQQIDAIIKNSDDWRGKRLSQLRILIKKTDTGIIEEVKWKKTSNPMGVPVWSCNSLHLHLHRRAAGSVKSSVAHC